MPPSKANFLLHDNKVFYFVRVYTYMRTYMHTLRGTGSGFVNNKSHDLFSREVIGLWEDQ